MVQNLPANAGDTGSIPGLGRSPGEGNARQWFDLDQMRKTESEGRVIGGDLIRRRVV